MEKNTNSYSDLKENSNLSKPNANTKETLIYNEKTHHGRLHNLREDLNGRLAVNCLFLILGIGTLCAYNALLSAIFWIDSMIAGWGIKSNTTFINMAGTIATNVFLMNYDLRNYKYMMLVEGVMAAMILAVPIVCLVDIGNGLQFAIWILIVVCNAMASGFNQTMTFSFASEIGNQAVNMTSLGMALGGMVISSLCLIFALSIHSEFTVFGVNLSADALSNLIYFSFSALVLVANIVAVWLLVTNPKVQETLTLSREMAKFSEFKNSDDCSEDDVPESYAKIMFYAVAMMIQFVITFTIFPTILFENYSNAYDESGAHRFSKDHYTIVIILIFNSFDVVGRSFTNFPALVLGKTGITVNTIVRGCVMLMVMVGIPLKWYPYDMYMYVFTALFAMMQGWAATSLFIKGPPKMQDRGAGGMIMSFTLLSGILIGSLISYILTSYVNIYISN